MPCELAKAATLGWLRVSYEALGLVAHMLDCNVEEPEALEEVRTTMSKKQEQEKDDPGGLDRHDELRLKIAQYAPMVDTPADQYAHNIVGIVLAQIAKEFGVAAANEAIEDFDLEKKGWSKRPVPEGD
jgi:hypothetical protein